MKYDVFRYKVLLFINRAGGGIIPRFFRDEEKGRYIAKCSDGTTIIENSTSIKATFRKGHSQFMAEI